MIKFIYSEKATKCCEISTVDLPYIVPVKSTVEIAQSVFPATSMVKGCKNDCDHNVLSFWWFLKLKKWSFTYYWQNQIWQWRINFQPVHASNISQTKWKLHYLISFNSNSNNCKFISWTTFILAFVVNVSNWAWQSNLWYLVNGQWCNFFGK